MTILQVPMAFIKKDFLNEVSYKLSFLLQFAGIFFSIITFYFLSKLVGTNMNSSLRPYGGDYFSFIIIGFAFTHYLQTSLQGFSSSIRETQLMGIMEVLLTTSTKLSTIIISSSLYKFLFTSLRIFFFIIVGTTLFSIDISKANYAAAIVILLFTITSFSCIGIIAASFIVVFKKGDPIAWLVTSLSWLLGGVYYPVSILPKWLQNISYILPITYSLKGIRLALLQGYSFYQLQKYIYALMIFTIILLPASLYIFRSAVKKAMVDGSLTQY